MGAGRQEWQGEPVARTKALSQTDASEGRQAALGHSVDAWAGLTVVLSVARIHWAGHLSATVMAT